MTHIELAGGVAVATGSPTAEATLTLSEDDTDDRRVVTVPSVSDALNELRQRCARWPHAAGICDDVLRAIDPTAPAFTGVITESLAYSTLQSGPEFARWLAERGPAKLPHIPDPVEAERVGDTLQVRFNRFQRHNAFSTDARAALLEALEVARSTLDHRGDPVRQRPVVLQWRRPGRVRQLRRSGQRALRPDPPQPGAGARRTDRAAGERCRAEVHGQVLGSGLEMAAFCGHVRSGADAVFGLPELSLGLIPGAGGTVSVTRRIGRWRTAYLVLSGRTIDPPTALRWGLIDEIV